MPASSSAAFERPPLVASAASRPELGVRKVDDVAVLDLRGCFTNDHTEHFREGIQGLLNGGTKVCGELRPSNAHGQLRRWRATRRV
jgi:hypothetical protein